jgi:hypothetical protein
VRRGAEARNVAEQILMIASTSFRIAAIHLHWQFISLKTI